MQVWSLDVDAAEQQLAVGGVSPQLQLYHIHSNSEAGGERRASKEVNSTAVTTLMTCPCDHGVVMTMYLELRTCCRRRAVGRVQGNI